MADLGNLARIVEKRLLDLFVKDSPVYRELITGKLAALRQELVGSNTTALENLLIERIVVCWLWTT